LIQATHKTVSEKGFAKRVLRESLP
jgi:hypothetical protein